MGIEKALICVLSNAIVPVDVVLCRSSLILVCEYVSIFTHRPWGEVRVWCPMPVTVRFLAIRRVGVLDLILFIDPSLVPFATFSCL